MKIDFIFIILQKEIKRIKSVRKPCDKSHFVMFLNSDHLNNLNNTFTQLFIENYFRDL